MAKTLLCVTYGGGHARMVIPVIRALADCKDIRIQTLALTGAGPIFKSEHLPFMGFKDFISAQDSQALEWGKKLAAIHHSPESGIEEEESIAYLGLSYWDLVQRYGEAEAGRLWAEKGRHAFLPLTFMERVIERVKPDMVVTTNSPRSERAALDVAQAKNIVTLCMVDLFGYMDFHVLKADYFTVLNERVIDTMKSIGVTAERDRFLITGNPAFDTAFDYRGPINTAWRRAHFPSVSTDAKCVLWIDSPGYLRQAPRMWMRDTEEILFDLNNMAQATADNNCVMLVRPHPSQARSFFQDWVQQAPPHVLYAGDVQLYPLLNAIDAVVAYSSTVMLETILMQKRLIQLQYFPEESGMPMAQWGLAWEVTRAGDLSRLLRDALHNEQEWEKRRERIAAYTPKIKAAPQIAEHIKKIIGV